MFYNCFFFIIILNLTRYAARLAHLRAEADVNADADNENDPVRAAKVALNDAMEADRAHRYEEAIEKYRSGIGLLLALRGDATHGQVWIILLFYVFNLI